MLTFTLPLSKLSDTLINDSNNLMTQMRKFNIAIRFLCHQQAHRNYTLLVGWFVYLLGIAAIAEIIVDHCHLERKSKVYIRFTNKNAENISETKKCNYV